MEIPQSFLYTFLPLLFKQSGKGQVSIEAFYVTENNGQNVTRPKLRTPTTSSSCLRSGTSLWDTETIDWANCSSRRVKSVVEHKTVLVQVIIILWTAEVFIL